MSAETHMNNMIDEAFVEYATRYTLIPGQTLSTQQALMSAGLDEPLPAPLQGMIELADALGHHAVVLPDEPLLKQWNPYTGRWPLYSEGLLGAQVLSDHRWLQRVHEAGVKVVYSALHEVTHGLWAALSQLGLLSLLAPYERARFHQASEACAVLISDLEGPERLCESGFFERFWPAGASRSHAVQFSPPQALAEAGLDQEGRAQWLFKLYLSLDAPLPQRPQRLGQRAEALAFLIEEANYAEKATLGATATWSRRYWGRAEIERYLELFVPAAPLLLPHLSEPITSVEGCASAWRQLTLELPNALEASQVSYLAARLSLQRTALKVCELEGAVQSTRLRLNPLSSPTALIEATAALEDARNTLNAELLRDLSDPIGVMSEQEREARISDHQGLLSTLQAVLSERLGPCLTFTHPLYDQLPFRELLSPLTPPQGAPPRDAYELTGILKLLCDEATQLITYLSMGALGEGRASEADAARALFKEAHRLIGELSLAQGAEASQALADVEEFLMAVKRQRALSLPYPLAWMSACSIVEPLIGFRYA